MTIYDADEPRCERCGKLIKEGRGVWLEMSTRTGKLHKHGVPQDESQGWFLYGPECWKKQNGRGYEVTTNA